MIDAEIEEFYARGLEVARLFVDGRPRLEFVRTLELLTRFLPAPPARVLDVGGGTGVYARELCDRGYRVVLVDPVPGHVDRAREITAERGLGEAFTADSVTPANSTRRTNPLTRCSCSGRCTTW